MGSEKAPEFRAGAPWYRNGDYYRYAAKAYLERLARLGPECKQAPEIFNSIAFNRARLIFESNLIEGAGLPSEGETRKLIEEHFPALPGQLKDYTRFFGQEGGLDALLSKDKLNDMRREIRKSGLPPEKVIASVSFAGRPRAFREVLQHYQALDYARYLTANWLVSVLAEMTRDTLKTSYQGNPKKRDAELRKLRRAFKKKRIRHKRVFTHTNLKKLHRVLAHGLMPDDAGVPAGRYRIDNRSVGWEIAFPAPELVQESMNNFVQRSDELLKNLISPGSETDLFQTAAEISYHFVRVHPFPDFNGRLSRIIMNMVLPLGACIIPIAIRGDRKGRQRYFTALRHANRGKMHSLGALIAMRVTETFQEVDGNLELAGLPTIWSVDVGKDGSNEAMDREKD